MTLEWDRIETVTFDSFTTLVDVAGPTTRRLSDFVSDPVPIARLWRSRAVDYRMLCNFVDAYAPYDKTTRDALEYALARFDESLPNDEVDTIAEIFSKLDVYDDVSGTIHELSAAGFDCYIISNGNPNLLDSIVRRADIEGVLAGIVSADEIETYKPARAFYEYSAQQTNTPLENIVHVATPWYDIYGANHAGMQTAWVNRNGVPWEAFEGEPDLIVDSLAEFLAQFHTRNEGSD